MTEKRRDSELDRWIATSDVPGDGLEVDIEADAGERTAIAERLGLEALVSLRASVRARRWRGDGLAVDGRLRARVGQICVVTLEPMESDIEETFAATYLPGSKIGADEAADELVVDPLSDDEPPEPLSAGRAPVGELIVETLALAIDPYPRQPGAALPRDMAADGDGSAPGAFEALRGFTKRSETG